MSKFVEARPYAQPEAAAKRLLEICKQVLPVQDGRIHIEKINYPFLFRDHGTTAEYRAGLDLLIKRNLLLLHESGTYVQILQPDDSLLG
ncbi:hypothetical protein ACIPUD_10635 [Bradyrhizobium sp. CAR08]